jgi:beta-phosphoglucomutase family hydrolase
MIKAFLFDLNGTMIDDMPFHITAWHKLFNDFGANFSRERAMQECYGKNDEILDRIFPGKFSQAEKNDISIKKETAYQKVYLPHLKLINGLPALLEEAKKNNIKIAIGSAAIMFNIDFVLDNLKIRHYFDAIVSADDVQISKPNAETYLKCAVALGVQPHECIVFEDVPKGVESAANASMKSIVITSQHTENEFAAFDNIIAFADNYENLKLKDIIATAP